MDQEDINEVMYNSLPEWRKEQLRRERSEEYYTESSNNISLYKYVDKKPEEI